MNGHGKLHDNLDAEADELEALTDSMTYEEKMQALEAAGFTRDEVAEFYAQQELEIQRAIERNPPKQDNVVPIRKAWYRRVPWGYPAVAACSGGFGVAATVIMQLATAASPPMQDVESFATAAAAPADTLRDEGYEQCLNQQWAACLDSLERARVIDPNEPPKARSARELALREVAQQKKH